MNNLKTARKAKHMTQVEVAKHIGLAQSSYSAWEKGTTKIDHESLRKLADLFDVSVDYLLNGTSVDREDIVKIPVLGSIPAGIPLEAIEDIIDWEEIPASLCSGGREYFALKVKGDSMWPEYMPGDTIIVQKTPCCTSGDDCVVYVNGYDATLKQIKLGEDGSITLVPINQNYAPRTYSRQEVATLPVSICGVVVELRRKKREGRA